MLDLPPIELPPRGAESQEKNKQEEREQTALGALYMSPAQIPESPLEPSGFLPEDQVDRLCHNLLHF